MCTATRDSIIIASTTRAALENCMKEADFPNKVACDAFGRKTMGKGNLNSKSPHSTPITKPT